MNLLENRVYYYLEWCLIPSYALFLLVFQVDTTVLSFLTNRRHYDNLSSSRLYSIFYSFHPLSKKCLCSQLSKESPLLSQDSNYELSLLNDMLVII